jgi:hypothetical protein
MSDEEDFELTDEEDLGVEPLKHTRRLVAPSHRFAGMFGATGRHLRHDGASREYTMTLSSRTDEVRFLSNAETLHGLPANGVFSVNKDRRWEAVAALTASAATIAKYPHYGRRSSVIGAGREVALSLDLPVTGMLLPRGERDSSLRQRLLATSMGVLFELPLDLPTRDDWLALVYVRAHQKPFRKLRVLYRPDEAPPPGVPEGSYLLQHNAVRISATGTNGTCRNLRRATVHRSNDHEACAWTPRDVQTRQPEYLQLDLGEECYVSHVSTRGRFPRSEQYPTSAQLDGWGGWGAIPREARVRVRAGVPSTAWTCKYQLFARRDGGRTWDLIGTFQGNTDGTTEVAHSLAQLVGGRGETSGLRCRALRFVPVEASAGGVAALRIGAYGTRISAGEGAAITHTAGARAAASGSEAAIPALVSYLLCGGPLAAGRVFDRARALRADLAAEEGTSGEECGEADAVQQGVQQRAPKTRQGSRSYRYSWESHVDSSPWNYELERTPAIRRKHARAAFNLNGPVMREVFEECAGSSTDYSSDDEDCESHGREYADEVAVAGTETISRALDVADASACADDESLELQLALTLSFGELLAANPTTARRAERTAVNAAAERLNWHTVTLHDARGSQPASQSGEPTDELMSHWEGCDRQSSSAADDDDDDGWVRLR